MGQILKTVPFANPVLCGVVNTSGNGYEYSLEENDKIMSAVSGICSTPLLEYSACGTVWEFHVH